MHYGDVYVRVVLALTGWDNQIVFYVEAKSIKAAEEIAWETFKEQRLNGITPVENWYLKEAKIKPFEGITIFIKD